MLPDMVPYISSVGFPIVAYFLQVQKSDKVQEKMADAVNNNTIALKELISLSKGE